MTHCYCGTLGGLYVMVGSLTYPSPDVCYDLPDLDTGPDGLQHSSWVLAPASTPKGEFVLLCVIVPCYASACLILQHIPPSMLMVRIVLCKC